MKLSDYDYLLVVAKFRSVMYRLVIAGSDKWSLSQMADFTVEWRKQ